MSVDVISKLKIKNGANSPIIDAEDGKGAWSTVDNVAARDLIPSTCRRLHMVVTLADTGISYELATGLTNADWVVKQFSAFSPIQSIRYLDGSSVLTPNGSIRAPYTDINDFTAEVASANGDWKLYIPGIDSGIGSWTLPDLQVGTSVTFEGIGAYSSLGEILVSEQTAPVAAVINFKSLSLDYFEIDTQDFIRVNFDRCILNGDIVQLDTITNAELSASHTIFSAPVDWTGGTVMCDNCTFNAPATISGTVRDSFFDADVEISFESLTLIDCAFDTDCLLTALTPGAPLSVDAYTYSKIIQAGVTIGGSPTITVEDNQSFPAEINAGNVSGAVNVSVSLSCQQKITLTGNTTVTLTNAPVGRSQTYQFKVVQGGAGSFSLAFAGAKTPNGLGLTLSAVAGSVDLVRVYNDGLGNLYASVIGLKFS